jgi:SAM-dependent methyltransferase
MRFARIHPPLAASLLLSAVPWMSACTAPAEESVKPGINAEYFKPDLDVAQWTERFEREGREIYDHRERIADSAGVRPGQRVADIGAGTGLFTGLLASRTGPSGKVIAVDIVPEFLARIAERAQRDGLRNVETVLCTERSVELPTASIDLAFICDAYHHFEFPRSTLATLHRALAAGGELVVIDFERVPGQSSEWVLGHVRAPRETFVAEIEAAGFELLEVQDWLKDNYITRFRKVGR